MPENLNIDGTLIPEERRRSQFKVILYKSDLNISGNFNNVAFKKLLIPTESVLWNEARLLIGISDFKGLQEIVKLQWNNETKLCDADFEDDDVVHKCVSTPIPLTESVLSQNNTFKANLKLNGTGEISFVPVGNTTNVHLSSSWKLPDFRGNTLAEFNKDFATKGLRASWKVLGINRNFPQQWKDIKPNLQEEAFGINLLQSMDSYSKTKRTIKYAILIIILTFATYYFTEIFNKKWVHAVQYTLIGFALVLFYTLLLSISEYLNFNAAYGIACLATVGLIAAYTQSVFSNIRTTSIFTGFLSAIYLFVYLLVQLEDTALIVGSVGLFLILAVIMFATRKINWFQKN
jgi:inner membrane protein